MRGPRPLFVFGVFSITPSHSVSRALNDDDSCASVGHRSLGELLAPKSSNFISGGAKFLYLDHRCESALQSLSGFRGLQYALPSNSDDVTTIVALRFLIVNISEMPRFNFEEMQQRVLVSPSQEKELQEIPGWGVGEEVSKLLDDTPSQQPFSASLIDPPSPRPTDPLMKDDSYNEAFESDRSQSPTRRRLSWGLASNPLPPIKDPQLLPSTNGHHVEAEQTHAALPSTSHGIIGDDTTYSGAENASDVEIAKEMTDLVRPEVADGNANHPLGWSGKASEFKNRTRKEGQVDKARDSDEDQAEDNYNGGFGFQEERSTSPKMARNEGACARRVETDKVDRFECRGSELGEEGVAVVLKVKDDGECTEVFISPASLESLLKTSTRRPAADEGEQHSPLGPPRSVQEKLEKLRGPAKKKSCRGLEFRKAQTLPKTVLDVVNLRADEHHGRVVTVAELLKSALHTGVNLPAPFHKDYFRG